MTKVTLTKTALREQQHRLKQLERYLPTLQLKKAMLQAEVYEARIEIKECEKAYERVRGRAASFSRLLTDREALHFQGAVRVAKIERSYENIAGVDVPCFEGISFEAFEYDLFETPPWTDSVVDGLRELAEAKARIEVAIEKKEALEKELRSVSIRVNLFEKNLIPRTKLTIKSIRVFLGDQELAAVSRAKAAKAIIEKAREEHYAR